MYNMYNKRWKYGKKSGFTLPEALVTSFVFLILALTMLGTLMMGMRYSRKTNAQIAAQQTCRNAMGALTNELRQAAVNIAPGSTGYLGITPAVSPTAVLYPNANVTQPADNILFTGINYAGWDPSDSAFNRSSPDNYKHIKYYVDGNILYRQEREISGGTLQNADDQPLAEARNGSISLSAKYLTPRQFEIEITVTEDKGQITQSSYTASTIVYIAVE